MHPSRLSTLTLLGLLALPTASFGQRVPPPVPDHTAGDAAGEHHDWNLGPTGARGWMWGWNLETTHARQILVTEVAAKSPADGVLAPGDVILGVGDSPFTGDPRVALGAAVTAAESAEGGGRLVLLRWRAGEHQAVRVQLPLRAAWAASAPWGCPKSETLVDAACVHLAGNLRPRIDGLVNALALLATGREEYRGVVQDFARRIGARDLELSLEGRTSGLFAWEWGYRNLFLCEYFLATGDDFVRPAIIEYSTTIARGQSGVGSWGHGMAWPDLNEGALHGRLGGYGAVNQSGLVCHLSLVLAQRCGVKDAEVDAAVARANRFFGFYAGKGAIPYGDHQPGWYDHDDNGKNSLAALIFDLQGLRQEARFFARMTVASFGERERGHTGNFFSYLWGPLGAARAGDTAAAAFLAEQRWTYDLWRDSTGRFPYQGGAGMTGGEHSYAGWDCTGIAVLTLSLPLRALCITGKDGPPKSPLSQEELTETLAAGRGFDCWDGGAAHYDELGEDELVRRLRSWSPAVRSRAADALGRAALRDEAALVRSLAAQVAEGPLESRYGACQALGALGARAAAGVPALTEALGAEDVWLRIQACLALAGIGAPARGAVPTMLQLAVRSDPADPREFTQRYLAFCLFYKGGALKLRGLLSRSVEGVDRDALRAAIARLLRNDDGRARSCLVTVFDKLTFEELRPLLPNIVDAVRFASPSGVMFKDGIRTRALEFLAEHAVAEGRDLALEIVEHGEWGLKDRLPKCLAALAKYGRAARTELPRLRELEETLRAASKGADPNGFLALCASAAAAIEAAESEPRVRSVAELLMERH
jgi:hypothetical protein